MKNKKGMSLIVLVITILVMIILAGVVIVSLSDNNPIKKASDAKEKSNFAEYTNELELYHTNNTALTPGYSKEELNVTDPNEMKKYIKSMSKEDTKKYVIIDGVLCNKEYLEKIKPKLMTGMTPVKWVNNVEQTTTADDLGWYKYVEGSNKSDHKFTRLANAKTVDGSYFVWIPRFEYKITYNNASDKSQGGEIDVNIITVDQTTPSSGYKIHPAFTNGTSNAFANGEWDKEISGIWVAKYEMSNKGGKAASLPHVASWRSITIGQIYDAAMTYDRAKESHMMKNSEWGAVAYFTHSKYGRNQNEVEINENTSFITGNGSIATHTNESSTGNITGIYDLSGCTWEYVAGYINNGDANLATYGSSFAKETKSTKYANVYPVGKPDTIPNNYQALANLLAARYGDALIETSVNGNESTTSFFSDYSYYSLTAVPFFLRGASYGDGMGAGTFSFIYGSGGAFSTITGRIVLCGL